MSDCEKVDAMRTALEGAEVVPDAEGNQQEGQPEGGQADAVKPGAEDGDPGPTPDAGAPADPGPPDDPPPAGGGDKKRVARLVWALPDGCPVTPLGTADGVYFYLDAVGQLRSLKARDHGNKDLLSLFAPQTDFVHQHWPRFGRDGDITGWRPEEAAEVLMCACARKGVWSAADRTRGRGAWTDDAGKLVMHVGDAVLINGDWVPTGLIDEFVYPSAPALARPVASPAPADRIDELLALLQTWNWARPDLDPWLLLGWLGAATVAGALEWRPLAWVTGDAGTGKSTLHRLIKGLMGAGLLASSDPTEAGIRQTLGHQTLPVAIDEAEADEDNRKLQTLVKLARQAASGGDVLRGGSDHSATRFQARSCFLLSSILIPPLKPQDRSRLAILDLLPLPSGGAEPALDADWMKRTGGIIMRRMIDGWPRFGETLRIYRHMLMQAGHGGRGADQFGTLLACADLLLADNVAGADDAAIWAERLAADALAETSDGMSESERCLDHLLTSSVALDGGSRPLTVAQWVAKADIELTNRHDSTLDEPMDHAERHMAVIGLRVVADKAPDGEEGQRWLAVSYAHQGLARLFAGSHWQAQSGANGVWGQALARINGAVPNRNVRIGGRQGKRVMVPMELVLAAGPDPDG